MIGSIVSEAFVGFYWTLPVNWVGFRKLPHDAEEAAAKSRTIRYQMELVRQRVGQHPPDKLVGEIVFMDTSPDRATEAVGPAVKDGLRRFCGDRKATLLCVNFKELKNWRPNQHLQRFIKEEGISAEFLSPDPLTIDGTRFDPSEHFEAWRKRGEEAKAKLGENALAGIQRALLEFPEGPSRCKRISDWMNERHIKTSLGNDWSEDNVRHYIRRKLTA